MTPPATIFKYLAFRMIRVAVLLLLGFSLIAAFADLAENLRFVSKYDKDNIGLALTITALRAPSLAHSLLPFILLFGAIWIFWQLNRRAEIAVLKSSGMSIWGLLSPVGLVAATTGLISVLVIDPVASRLLAYSERLKSEAQGRPISAVRVFGDGLWLRQREGENILIINASSIATAREAMSDVSIWRLDRESRFLERVDAPEAIISGRTIELKEARIRGAEARFDLRTPVYAIASSLTADDFRERLDLPETMSIWQLPRFILLAGAAGLPTTAYDLRFHELCSMPLKLVAMVLFAAIFSMRPIRAGGTFLLFAGAVTAGFAFFILSEISGAVGQSGVMPPVLAAWAPTVFATVASAAGLLFLDEG